VMAFSFAAFALVTNVREYVIPVRARMRARSEGALPALGRVVFSNPRRYGGYFAHLGIVVMAVGITASSALQTTHEATLRPGQYLEAGDFSLRFEQMWSQDQPQRFTVGASLTTFKNGRELGTMEPRLNYYPTQEDPVPTPAVRSRMTDLYVVLMAFQPDGSTATIQAIVEPLVIWIWTGGVMIAVGAAFGLVFSIGREKSRTPTPREGSGTGRGAAGPRDEKEFVSTGADP
jgi:cytochrome c-type biogenesis protein CcmF